MRIGSGFSSFCMILSFWLRLRRAASFATLRFIWVILNCMLTAEAGGVS